MSNLYTEDSDSAASVDSGPLYTEENSKPAQVKGRGNYGVLKALSVAANGPSADDGSGETVDYERYIDQQWRKGVPESQAMDEDIAQQAVYTNNETVLESAYRSINARLKMYGDRSTSNVAQTRLKLEEIARLASENVVVATPAIIINNSVAEISNSVNATSKTLAAQASLDSQLESINSWVSGIGFELTPLSAEQGPAIDRAAVKFGAPPDRIDRTTGRTETVRYLQAAFQALPEEEKLDWANRLIVDLKDSIFISDWQAAMLVSQVVYNEKIKWAGFSDWADRLGVVGVIASGAYALLRAGKVFSMANTLSKAARTVAAGGGKSALVKGDVAKALDVTVNMERARAAGIVLGEATGIGAILDLTKLVGVSAAKILPDAVLTGASEVQQVFRNSVDKLIKDLQQTVASKGIKAEEAAAQLDELNKIYSPANNPNVHNLEPWTLSVDGTTLSSKVTYKPIETSSYLTQDAAIEAARVLSKQNTGNFRVVPDTTNTGFLVTADYKQSLIASKQQLEAELLQQLEAAAPVKAKRTRKAKTTEGTTPVKAVEDVPPAVVAEVRAPASLTTSKPRYAASTLTFGSEVDKALYQVTSKTKPSKTDGEVRTWLKSTYKLTDTQIDEYGEEVRNAVKDQHAIADEGADIVVEQITALAQGSGSTPSVAFIRDASEIANVENATRVGNVTVGSGFSSKDQTDILGFVNDLGTSLGMGKRKILVLDYADAQKSTNPLVKNIVDDIRRNHPAAGAMHYNISDFDKTNNVSNASVIVMKRKSGLGGGGLNRTQFIETFAHEYGHAFEQQFVSQYSGTMKTAFLNWLDARGVKWVDQGASVDFANSLPIEFFMEFRSLTNADSLVELVKKWDLPDGRGVTGQKLYEADMQMAGKWAGMYSEFFAENFAKWAFTDAKPTGILGQAFSSLVGGFKLIALKINTLMSTVDAPFNVSKANAATVRMLNNHIRMLEKNPSEFDKAVVTYITNSRSGKATTGRNASTVQSELSAVDETLGAIDAAEKGLKTGWLIERDISSVLTYASSVGKFTDADINSAARFTLGDRALEASVETYSDRLVGVNQQSRYQKLLTEFVRPELESLNRSERVHLTDALTLGDKESRILEDVELAGMGLSKRTRNTYAKVRVLRDVLYQVRNDVASKSLIRRGYVQLNTKILADDGVGKFFGKAVTPKLGSTVFVADEGKIARVGDSFGETATNNGWRIFELEEPVMVGGKYRKTIALTDKSFTTQKISEVIPYRAGEHRRIYSDEYFVKHSFVADIDGTPVDMLDTLRTARSVGDANAYVKAFNEAIDLHKAGTLDIVKASKLLESFGWKPENLVAELATGKYDTGKLEVRFNRTDDDYMSEAIGMSSSFSSKRGDRVLSVHGEDTVNTLSPLDSIASEIGNTAYVASVTEWRESHVQKWYNTFIKELPAEVQQLDANAAFAYMLNNKGRYTGTNMRMRTAEKTQDYIVSQLNIPTKEEKAFMGTMRVMSENIEGLASTGMMHRPMALTGAALRSTKDYATWARTVAFHSFFAFNPVQFFMQGMNAFNAVAISPLHGIKSAKTSALYAMALMSDQEEIWMGVAKANKLTSLGLGMKEDEFVEVVRAIRRLGLMDGINSTSLYGAETGTYGIMNGFTRKVATLAATPFNAGEGYSRLVSFDISRREFMTANEGVAWWTDDALKTIMKRQDDLTQNMTKANTASWQRGWKSIPLQFTQYQTKMFVNIVQSLMGNSRVFTRKEALQLLITHSAVMGTAGSFLWPFRDLVTSSMPEDMTEEQRLYVQQGVVSGMIGTLTQGEAKLALGSRFNTFKYYEDLAKGLIDPEKNTWELLTGPSGFAGLRILGGVGEAISIISKAPPTMATLQAALIEVGKTSFSALNNVQKTRMALANYNKVTSSNGGAMFRVTDTEAWLLSFGLPPVAQEDLSIMYRSRKAHGDDLKAAAKVVGYHANLALTAIRKGDDASADTHRAIVQYVMHSYEGDDFAALMTAAYKVESFTMYEKMLVEQMVKQYEVPDTLVDTGAVE